MKNNIREMLSEEINEVVDIWYKENISSHPFIPSKSFEDNIERTKNKFLKSKVYICRNEIEIQGFICLSGNYIDSLFVKSEYRRQGIGKSLLKHCKSIFWSLMSKIYMQNETAVKFFENQSFFVRDKMDSAETGKTELFMEWIR